MASVQLVDKKLQMVIAEDQEMQRTYQLATAPAARFGNWNRFTDSGLFASPYSWI
jgi:hypothetical protein